MFAFIGNIGFGEIVIIAIIGLILFGERLPEVAKSIGKTAADLNKSLKDTRDTILNPNADEPVIDKAPKMEKQAEDRTTGPGNTDENEHRER